MLARLESEEYKQMAKCFRSSGRWCCCAVQHVERKSSNTNFKGSEVTKTVKEQVADTDHTTKATDSENSRRGLKPRQPQRHWCAEQQQLRLRALL